MTVSRQINEERLARYRKAYPDDTRSDAVILGRLKEERLYKKNLDRWIEREVYECWANPRRKEVKER